MELPVSARATSRWLPWHAIVVFGFLFVTVSSRIVGLVGSSASPVSGMTIATLMATCAVFLVMGYSNCPLLCSQVLGELTRSLKPLDPSIGKDFDIVTVSIKPKETQVISCPSETVRHTTTIRWRN